MDAAQVFYQEFDIEGALLRRCLERVPDDALDWKPHPRSMSLGHLVDHLTHFPYWVVKLLEGDDLDMENLMPPLPLATTEVRLERFDQMMAEARAALASTDTETLDRRFEVRFGSKSIAVRPRREILKAFVLNHTIHHRGQLMVYFRLLGVPVPRIYGRSADEM